MARITVIRKNKDGVDEPYFSFISEEQAEKLISMLELKDMLNARVKDVNVQDLTQTPKNKFTDEIGG